MTAVAYASGRHAWADCQKCGLRFKYTETRLDRYFPNLRVCFECFDDKHPQERLLKVADPTAIWMPGPESVHAPTAPVLAGLLAGNDVTLTWLAAAPSIGASFRRSDTRGSTSQDGKVSVYRLYRALGEADFVQIAELEVVRDAFAAVTSEPLSYVDNDLLPGQYSYNIQAHDSRSFASDDSNVVTVTVP